MNKMQRKKFQNSIFKRKLKEDIDYLEIISLTIFQRFKIEKKEVLIHHHWVLWIMYLPMIWIYKIKKVYKKIIR